MDFNVLNRPDGPPLAYARTIGRTPCVMFLGGFRSDMQGTKAMFLENLCKSRGQAFIRFDYRGHGSSGGAFTEATIGMWLQDVLDIIDRISEGPLLLVGSSMGGWLSFLAVRARPERVKGLVGIAAAPDFTRTIKARMSQEQHNEMAEKGFINLGSDYSLSPYVITRTLLEEAENHCLLDKRTPMPIPVRLIQGMRDADVEWQTAYRIRQALECQSIEVSLVEHGDHRLTRPEDLDHIGRAVADILASL